jgi:hypothetical protein
MICCAIAALFVAVTAAWRVIAYKVGQARWTAALLAASVVLIGGSALAALHHDRAANDDLAAILMRHICGQHPIAQPPAN